MKVKWSGIVAVALITTAIVAYKVHTKRMGVVESNRPPRILLVADLSEADSADACAEIIHAVRAAGKRGVHVLELNPDSKSEMLRRYSVLTIPTVLIFDRNGQIESRFEGENRETVETVRTQLAQLHQ